MEAIDIFIKIDFYGYGDGDGSGDGYGYGDGYGNGDGSGDGDGISFIYNQKVYQIDGVPTIISQLHNNVAQGYILKSDLTLSPCFIVKENNKFAHGRTLHEAFESIHEKLYDDSSEEERILKFKEHFLDFNKKHSARELFIWHHVLTGSCKAGRESFAKDHEIDLDKDEMTVYDFIKLTKDHYNGDIIEKILI